MLKFKIRDHTILERLGNLLTIAEGALKESVIKANCIYTISRVMVIKRLFSLSNTKEKDRYEELEKRFIKLTYT